MRTVELLTVDRMAARAAVEATKAALRSLRRAELDPWSFANEAALCDPDTRDCNCDEMGCWDQIRWWNEIYQDPNVGLVVDLNPFARWTRGAAGPRPLLRLVPGPVLDLKSHLTIPCLWLGGTSSLEFAIYRNDFWMAMQKGYAQTHDGEWVEIPKYGVLFGDGFPVSEGWRDSDMKKKLAAADARGDRGGLGGAALLLALGVGAAGAAALSG